MGRDTIREIWRRCKGFALGGGMVPLLIMLVGFAAFGLGRLSAQEHAAVQIIPPDEQKATVSAAAVPTSGDGQVVVSVNGSKYHFPWCPSAQRIKEANKQWFDSIEEARAAGYEPAANCKGLE